MAPILWGCPSRPWQQFSKSGTNVPDHATAAFEEWLRQALDVLNSHDPMR